MKISVLKSTNPYYNLAVEEYLFKNSDEECFLLWQNEPTVVIGKNQNAFAEVNLDFVKEKNIHVARRITGGGAVYHDFGNLNYSYISTKSDAEIDFLQFTVPIISALKKMGVLCELSGRNDILIGDKKISGNAQANYNSRVLHHGTLLFDSDLEILSSALKIDREKIQSKAIKSVKTRVTNIKPYLNDDISVLEFAQNIAQSVAKEYNAQFFEILENEEISTLYQRNASEEWLFPKRDYLTNYSFSSKKKFDFGIISVNFSMSGEIISNAKIEGDFFQKKDVRELEDMMLGKSFSEMLSLAKDINFSDYIHGMKKEDFFTLLEK